MARSLGKRKVSCQNCDAPTSSRFLGASEKLWFQMRKEKISACHCWPGYHCTRESRYFRDEKRYELMGKWSQRAWKKHVVWKTSHLRRLLLSQHPFAQQSPQQATGDSKEEGEGDPGDGEREGDASVSTGGMLLVDDGVDESDDDEMETGGKPSDEADAERQLPAVTAADGECYGLVGRAMG